MTPTLLLPALIACAVPVSLPELHWRVIGPAWIAKVDSLQDQGTHWISSTPPFTDRGVGCGSLDPALVQVFKAAFQVPVTGPYLTELLSDDFATLSIRDGATDEVLKLSSSATGSGEYAAQSVVLEAGVRYTVKLENWDAHPKGAGVAASIGVPGQKPVLQTSAGPEWTALVLPREVP